MFFENKKYLISALILSTLIFIGMVLLITYLIYSYKKKQLSHLKLINKLKVEHKNLLLLTQIEIQEQTFQHISREIHDNIGQKLSLAKLHLNRLNVISNQGPVEVIGEVIKELRDLSRSLSSDVLLHHGLVRSIEMEVEQVMKVELFQIKFRVIGEPLQLSLQQELIAFRIIQEAIQNILKHANAFTIEIELHYSEDYLLLKIVDNGKGFVFAESSFKGMGLENMRKRANMINGDFIIDSHTGGGTIVTLKIPYNAQT